MIGSTEFRRIYVMQVVLAVADAVAFNFMLLYLFKTGFRLEQLLLALTLAFATPVMLIAIMRRARAKLSFSLAFTAKIAAYLIALSWCGPITVNFIYIANALVLVFFWVPYNLEFFSYATERTRAYSGSVAIAIYPLVGLIIPAFAAYLWHVRGFAANIWLAISILGASVVYILLNNAIRFRSFDYDIRDSLRSLARYKTLFVLQGFWEASAMIGVPVFTLIFIKTELNLGLFYSYLGVLSVAATMTLARLSDRSKKRTAFLYPGVVFGAGATIAVGFAGSTHLWLGMVGLLNFITIIVTPFLIAVALDAPVSGIKMWAGRELLLNTGRAIGGASLLAAYRITGDYRLGFVILGCAFLLFALLVHSKRIYPRVPIIPGQPAR